jgi:hypothetical protein
MTESDLGLDSDGTVFFDQIIKQIEQVNEKDVSSGVTKALTIRISLSDYAAIDALSEISGGVAKNTIVTQLLHAAIANVYYKLSEKKKRLFFRHQTMTINNLSSSSPDVFSKEQFEELISSNAITSTNI